MVPESMAHRGWLEQARINFGDLFQSIGNLVKTPNKPIMDKVADMDPHLIEDICSISCPNALTRPVKELEWITLYEVIEYKVKNKDPIILMIILITVPFLIYKIMKSAAYLLSAKNTKDFDTTNIELNTEVTGDEVSTKPSHHFPAEQRALLQFQRNKSEPIVFRYGFNFEDNSSDMELPDQSTEEVIRGSLNGTRTPSPMPSPPLPSNTFKDDDLRNMHSNILKLTETPQKFKDTSIVESTASKLPGGMLIPLSISPSKPTINTTQVSSEQANAEPFKF